MAKEPKEKQEELLKAALQYQKRGWSIFPLQPGTKEPSVKRWTPYQKKIADEQTIRKWYEESPLSNIALVTGKVSEVIVLDVDNEVGEQYVGRNGIPLTLSVKTKRGRHLYFQYPRLKVRSIVRKDLGFQIQCDRRYVLLPPSIHPNGIKYQWLGSPTQEIAKAPTWLLELIKQKKEKPSTRKPKKPLGKSKIAPDMKPCIDHLLAASTEIRKKDNAFIAACELFSFGKSEAQIDAILRKLEVNEEKVGRIIESVRKGIYTYKCEHLEKEGLCLFKDKKNDCLWYKKRLEEQKKKHKGTEEDFFIYGWDKKLKRTDRDLYLALKTVESRKGYGPGSRLFISQEYLCEISRVTRCTIRSKLEVLRGYGLIKYIPGKKRVRGSKVKATEVWRVIPIPKPSNG